MENKTTPFSLSDIALCLRREVRMRYAVYPGKVADEKSTFTQADMDREIALMEAAADALEKMAKNGLFREAWNVLATSRAQNTTEQLPDELERVFGLLKSADLMARPADAASYAIKLSGLFLHMAELYKAEAELPGKPEAAASAPASPIPTPSVASAASTEFVPNPDFVATKEQSEEIMRLVNNPKITRSEKTSHLLNVYKYRQDKAQEVIAKLRGWIEERENGKTAA
ncbi:hypothetical protein [Hymenobacter algoricola]|uniref:Uncharacterized protein n=1 Tax=Hymenobacter algoricola TaxID=486267 RepID=A0ABP7N9M0_9BACT